MNCILHIGTHKTGTTSLQTFLTRNAGALRADGVLVPMTGRPIETAGHPNVGHHGLAWLLNDDPRYRPQYGTLEALRNEIVEESKARVVLSSMDFEYLHARPQSLKKLRCALQEAGCRTTVVLYLRPQAEYIQSLYLDLLKHGLTVPIAEFARAAIADGQIVYGDRWIFQLDYERLIAPFAEAFGADDVIVRAYCSAVPEMRLLDDFVQLLYAGRAVSRRHELVFPVRLNQRVGPGDALELLRRNGTNAQGEEHRAFQLTDEMLRKLQARFERPNAALARYLGAPLPVSQGTAARRELAGSSVTNAQ